MSDTSQSNSIIIQPDWIKQIIFASEREAAETIGLKLVKEEVRCVVWNMANTLGFNVNGVPGRACRLLERYFYFLFQSYEKIPRGALRTAILESVKNRLMLIIACCVQLSAKMSSAETCISPRVLRVALICKGITCTVSEIVQTEAEVYAVLGYRIPLWTSVDIGEQLANEIGISRSLMMEVALIVDMAEYLRNIVERKMRWAATGSSATHDLANGLYTLDEMWQRDMLSDGVSTLHLSAGAVVVAARLEPICSTQQATHTTSATESALATNVARLARLVDAPLPYLTCLADIIFAAIRREHQNKSTPLILKRKRNN